MYSYKEQFTFGSILDDITTSFSKTFGREVAQETAEKAAKEAAQEIAQKVAKEAAQEASQAAVKSARSSLEELLQNQKKLLKPIGGESLNIPRAPSAPSSALDLNFGRQILDKGKDAAGRNADSFIDGAKTTAKAKSTWDQLKNISKNIKKGTMEASKEIVDFAKRNPKLTVAGVTVTVLLIMTADRLAKMNGRVFQISSVKNKEKTNYLEIKFNSDTNLVEEDTIDILECDAEPSLVDKKFTIVDVQDTQTILVSADFSLTKEGTLGTFRYNTDFSSSFKGTTRETIKGATNLGKDIVIDLADIGGDIGGAAVGGFFEGVGLGDFFKKSSTIIYIICAILLTISILFGLAQLRGAFR
jgi:hypothetical protein